MRKFLIIMIAFAFFNLSACAEESLSDAEDYFSDVELEMDFSEISAPDGKKIFQIFVFQDEDDETDQNERLDSFDEKILSISNQEWFDSDIIYYTFYNQESETIILSGIYYLPDKVKYHVWVLDDYEEVK